MFPQRCVRWGRSLFREKFLPDVGLGGVWRDQLQRRQVVRVIHRHLHEAECEFDLIRPPACLSRAPGFGKGKPAATNSFSTCPAPSPISRRPPVAESTLAKSRASSAGRKKKALVTKLPTRTAGAAAARGTSGGSSAVHPRWSTNDTTSKPICSARRASTSKCATGHCLRVTLGFAVTLWYQAGWRVLRSDRFVADPSSLPSFRSITIC
jgi:hypothetical protein